jgi:hypothetical protein
MKIDALKKIIKEAVKEAIQEEMKEILLEAIKTPKGTLAGVEGYGVANNTTTPPAVKHNIREQYSALLDDMAASRNGNINMTSADAMNFKTTPGYQPAAAVNTAGEGSSLPPGEVSLDQLMGFMNKR